MSLEIYTLLRNFVSTAAPTMLIAGVIFIVCILIWLILRPLNYWYWKVEQRDRILENMDKKISEIRYIQMRDLGVVRCTRPEEPNLEIKNCQEMQKPQNQTSPIAETGVLQDESRTCICKAETEKQDDCPDPAKVVTPSRKFTTLEDAIDKTGTVYTREHIEQKIRF